MFLIKPLPEFIEWLDGSIRCDGQLMVLLVGGSKRTQKTDIKRAKALAALLE